MSKAIDEHSQWADRVDWQRLGQAALDPPETKRERGREELCKQEK